MACVYQAYVSVCLCVKDRSTFRRIVLKNAFNKRKMYEALLESVPMLNTLEVRSVHTIRYDRRV